MVFNPHLKQIEQRKKSQEKKPEPEEEQQQPPSVIQKASNFAIASAKYARSGFKKVSAEVKEGRLAICKGCKFRVGEEEDPGCNKCGCPLNIKTEWATESCPIGKWSSTFGKNQSRGCGSCSKKKT